MILQNNYRFKKKNQNFPKKVHGPIFQNLVLNHHSKDVNFKFQLKGSSRLDVRSN